MAPQTTTRRLAFTEEELANLLASEYRRGYGIGIVIGRSGAILEQVATEREQDIADARDSFVPHWLNEPFRED